MSDTRTTQASQELLKKYARPGEKFHIRFERLADSTVGSVKNGRPTVISLNPGHPKVSEQIICDGRPVKKEDAVAKLFVLAVDVFVATRTAAA